MIPVNEPRLHGNQEAYLLAGLNLQPGDEVILPAFTIISCAQAVVYKGGVPVLVDADPNTWVTDVTQVEAKITPRTRAIMVVHIDGHPVDTKPIWALAEKYHLTIIEDAAEAHGAECYERRCGGLGDFGCFSFYANKIVTTGEGGMILARIADPLARQGLYLPSGLALTSTQLDQVCEALETEWARLS